MSVIKQQWIKDTLKDGSDVDTSKSYELELEIDKQIGIKNEPSEYQPTPDELAIRQMILRHFTLSSVIMFTPRVEFNDMSVIYRDQEDWMRWNTYQPNNGNSNAGDQINGWHSNAISALTRNKCISIGAHATARLLFPKIFAHDSNSESQQDAAQVLSDLMEYSGEQCDYAQTSLRATIQAEVAPASIVHTEYNEVYREVKRIKNPDGTWFKELVLDETLSGFKDTIVPVDQIYIENFYEPDIQKQGWLLWRRVQSYSLMETKYGKKYPNFKHVKPGVQLIYNDANQTFYNVYDTNMRPYMCEEIIYWNRSMDLMIIMVNGVMLTTHDNPNPRNDKLMPFAKFGYEFIDNRCFYYKSLAFKLAPDDRTFNTLYPMIVDGTYLNVMPPLINQGGEIIGSDVIVPGAVTTFSDPNSSLTPVKTSTDLKSGMEMMSLVDKDFNQTSEIPLAPQGGQVTAYQISKAEQERNTLLGLFVNMIGQYVKQYGVLRLGDIMQYLTVADVDKITDDPELVYKTFLLHNKKSNGKSKTRKIKFDQSLPAEPMSDEQKMNMSYETLHMEGGQTSDQELYRVNPELFRNLKYMVVVSPDVLNPLSEEVERAFMLEEYDRAIQNPLLDQEKVTKDFLLSAYPKSAKDPDAYLQKQGGSGIMGQINAATQGQQQPQGQPQQNPLAALQR